MASVVQLLMEKVCIREELQIKKFRKAIVQLRGK